MYSGISFVGLLTVVKVNHKIISVSNLVTFDMSDSGNMLMLNY